LLPQGKDDMVQRSPVIALMHRNRKEDVMSKSSRLAHGMLVLLLALVVGCSSYPQARYYKAGGVDPKKDANVPGVQGDVKGKISFILQGALVTITKPGQENPQAAKAQQPGQANPQAQKPKPPEIQQDALGLTNKAQLECSRIEMKDTQAFATPANATDSHYILVSEETIFTKSNISVTYYDGTRRIKTIGTELQDDRIKIIGAVGGTIATIVSAAMLADEGKKDRLNLPYVFDFSDPKKFKEPRDTFSSWETIPGYNCYSRYKVSKPEGNVFKTEEFFKNQDFTREFPVSACVDLTLEIGKGAGGAPKATDTVMSYTVRVPDPSYVDPVPFPIKGTITTHSVCGADISTQPSQSVSTFETLEAIAKQVENIKKAAQKKTTTEETKTPDKNKKEGK